MAPQKVTIMVLKVDLQCSKCYRKVKKVLCKFPQVRDQLFDEKSNTVTITVVCCSPEKVRDKLCCKGNGAIKSIEIKPPPQPKLPAEAAPPPKPKETEKPKDQPPPTQPEKPKEPGKPKEPEKTKQPEKPKETEPPKSQPQPPAKPSPPPPPQQQQPAPPVQPFPRPLPMYPIGVCCGSCYEGRGGGPCYQMGYGGPPPPIPCYEGYGRPVYDNWGGGGGGYRSICYVNRCDPNCFSEENPQGCSIM